MVNYRRVVCEVAVVAALVALAAAAPVPDVHYDQRQNGTENYRLNIDGVVIAIAPAESFVAAASEIDLGDLLDLDYFMDIPKPSKKPPQEPAPEPKPEEQSKPEEQKPIPEEGTPLLLEDKPKPQEEKPEEPAKPEAAPSNLKSYHHAKGQKKDASTRKQSRLRNYMYSILGSLMKNRHHQAANQ